MADYDPGTCNINQSESRKRYLAGVAGISAAVLFSMAYLSLSSESYMLVFVFIAATVGFQGFLQGRKNFCVAHARKGTRKTAEETEEVEDDEDRTEDVKTANKIILESVVLGVLLSLSVYLSGIVL